ncbi:hypothetical protein D3C85_1231700 [compost metagenome]
MGRQDGVGHAGPARGVGRFGLEDIQRGPAQPPVTQGGDDGVLVDQLTARDIDQQARRPQGLDHLGRNQVAIGFVRATGDDQNVRGAGQVDQAVGAGPGGFFLARRPPLDLHPHDLGAASHGLADSAQADDADGLAAQRGGDGLGGRGPTAGAHLTVALGDLASCSQDQANGVVGDVFVVDGRGVGDG